MIFFGSKYKHGGKNIASSFFGDDNLIKKKVIGVRNASYKKGNWNNYITRFLDISVSKQNDETAYHFEVWSNEYGILF